eukprot:9434454-Pyramimonas_sp.AAC.1
MLLARDDLIQLLVAELDGGVGVADMAVHHAEDEPSARAALGRPACLECRTSASRRSAWSAAGRLTATGGQPCCFRTAAAPGPRAGR